MIVGVQTSPTHSVDICRRCGRCCYVKLRLGGVLVETNQACSFLDTQSRLCTVYEERFQRNRGCLTVEEAIREGVFPQDCSYVAGLEGYKGPVDSLTDEEKARLEDLFEEVPE